MLSSQWASFRGIRFQRALALVLRFSIPDNLRQMQQLMRFGGGAADVACLPLRSTAKHTFSCTVLSLATATRKVGLCKQLSSYT
jgi:hypothetical protein